MSQPFAMNNAKKTWKSIGFFKRSIYWTSKGAGRRYLTKKAFDNAMSFLINKFFFTIGNMVFKQDIGIQMSINPASFLANLFLYIFEYKFIKQLISSESSKACKYHGVSRFIDDLCAINDDSEFLTLFENIYPKYLELIFRS